MPLAPAYLVVGAGRTGQPLLGWPLLRVGLSPGLAGREVQQEVIFPGQRVVEPGTGVWSAG